MKGVSMIRLKYRPVALCQHEECDWSAEGGTHVPAVRLRSWAERHVQITGHIVDVDILDRTEYARAVTSDE
jgi:hypothetical protein